MPLPIEELALWPGPEHARWGQSAQLPIDSLQRITQQYSSTSAPNICNLEHPIYVNSIRDWEKWRNVYEGGESFIQEHVVKFSHRETPSDFLARKKITPISAFASSAVDEIKNSIFQRIGDTTRTGGSQTYRQSVIGQLGGVNLHGATMNWFIGHYVLPDLLVQKKIGIYVDAPGFGRTIADKGSKHPYFLPYRAEDIKTWKYANSGSENEFSAVLLREYKYLEDSTTGLPIREIAQYRHVFLNTDGFVTIQYYDWEGLLDGPAYTLQIKKIPFVAFEITQSLMKNVANHQIAATNMQSSDVSYILKSNYPMYTEQFDSTTENEYLRSAKVAYNQFYNTANGTGNVTQSDSKTNIDAGPTQGRRYPKGTDRPGFIAPPAEPIRVSMDKQSALQDDARALVHLALAAIQSRSAESKILDRQQGLESGLASIGLELEHGERQLAEYWAMYEGTDTPVVIYPKYWSIKSTEEVQKEIATLSDLRDSIPSHTFKREINKLIAEQALATRVSPDVLETINAEILQAKGSSSAPKIVNEDVLNGILSAKTASELRDYPEGEVDAAQNERAARLASIAEAQATGTSLEKAATKQATAEDEALSNPAARGVPDLAADPAVAKVEKINKPGRGEAK